MSRLQTWLDGERPPQAAPLGWRCFQLALLVLPASALLAGLLLLVALIQGCQRRAPWWQDRLNLVLAAVAYLHQRARWTMRLGLALLDLTAQELKLIKLRAPKKFVKPE